MKAYHDDGPYEPDITDVWMPCMKQQSKDLIVGDGRFELLSIHDAKDDKTRGPFHFNHFITFFRKSDLLKQLTDEQGVDVVTQNIRKEFCNNFNPNLAAKVEFFSINNSKLQYPTRFMGYIDRLIEPIFDKMINSAYYVSVEKEKANDKKWNERIQRVQDEIKDFWPDFADWLDYFKDNDLKTSNSLYQSLIKRKKIILALIRTLTNNTHYDWVSLRVKNEVEPKLVHNHVVGTTLWDTKTENADPKRVDKARKTLEEVIHLLEDLVNCLKEIMKLYIKYIGIPTLSSGTILLSLSSFISALERLPKILKYFYDLMPETNGKHFLCGQRTWRFGVWGQESEILYFETAALERFSDKAFQNITKESKLITIYNAETKKDEQVYPRGAVLHGVEDTWINLLHNVTSRLGVERLDPREKDIYPNNMSEERINRNISLFRQQYYDYTRAQSPEDRKNVFFSFFEDNNLDELTKNKQVKTIMNRNYSLKPENMPRTLDDL